MEIKALEEKGLTKTFRIDIPSNQVKDYMFAYLAHKRSSLKVPGFRAGNAPADLLFRTYGSEALEKALEHHINEAIQKILKEHPLELAGSPSYKLVDENSGLSRLLTDESFQLAIDLFFEIVPAIDFIDVSKESITSYEAVISESDVDQWLNQMAASHQTSERYEDEGHAAQKGDTLAYVLTYETKDGQVTEREGVFILGQGMFPAEFEDTLVGITSGHVIQERLRVPKFFPGKELAGKKVLFKILFKEVRKTVPQKVDEAFALSLGYANLNELKEAAHKQLARIATTSTMLLKKRQVVDIFKKKLTFDVPQTVLDQEFAMLCRHIVKDARTKSRQDLERAIYERTGKTLEELRKATENDLLHNARKHLYLDAYVTKNSIALSEDDLTEMVRTFAQEQGATETQAVQYLRSHPQEFRIVERITLENKALMLLAEQCPHTSTSVSFTELQEHLNDTPAQDKGKAKAKKDEKAGKAEKEDKKDTDKDTDKAKPKGKAKSDHAANAPKESDGSSSETTPS